MAMLEKFLAERDWEKFHDPKNLTMSIAIEAAELMELFQWKTSGESAAAALEPDTRECVRDEVADVMLYCLDLCRILDIDPGAAMKDKIAKNADRYPPERFRGVARKYDSAP
jgi:NTP pyrophosphatase (non-canonical NTP hydrolase)